MIRAMRLLEWLFHLVTFFVPSPLREEAQRDIREGYNALDTVREGEIERMNRRKGKS